MAAEGGTACGVGEQAALPYTGQVERHNGVVRDRLACLTRQTHAFAKREETWTAAFSLTLFEHNRVLHHVALRQRLAEPEPGRRYRQPTPAMVLGVADIWSRAEFLTHPGRHGI